MKVKFETLAELKRGIYLWVIPCIVLSLITNTILQYDISSAFNTGINSILAIWFSISWFFLLKSKYIPFTEYSNLSLVSFYHITTFYDALDNYMAVSGGSLGDFIVWMPIYLLFIFLTLGTRRGFYFSIAIFVITLVNGLFYINGLDSESIDSLGQFYFANLVYIIVLYYAQNVFRTYADLEMFKKHAYIDSLTNIANRLQIDEVMERKLEAAKRTKEDFSIIFFDIDHFKQVNDYYGHKIGDAVLVELAGLIQGHLSNQEFFGRWGGEEFVIISNQSGADTVKLAENLREMVAAHEFKGAGKLTASFGVTNYHHNDSIDSLLNRVDRGLYKSKDYGRNCVSFVS
jgi:diguanylate cyclase (GGDEF)-like protein